MRDKLLRTAAFSLGVVTTSALCAAGWHPATDEASAGMIDMETAYAGRMEYMRGVTGQRFGIPPRDRVDTRRTADAASTVVGWHNYPSAGWYRIYMDGTQEELWSSADFDLTAGFYRDGRVCGFSDSWPAAYREYDMTTGELLLSREMDSGWLSVWECAYDSRRDMIFAYAWKSDYSGFVFEAIDPDTFEVDEIRSDVDTDTGFCPAMTFNQSDGTLYGINRQGLFCSIDGTSGDLTEVFDTGVALATYMDAMTYSPKDGVYVWVNPSAGGATSVYTLDAGTGVISRIGEFATGDQYHFLLTPDLGLPGDSPADLTLVSFDFPGGALSGSVVMTAPSSTIDGNPIVGELTVRGSVDGRELPSVMATPGEQVVFRFDGLDAGEHKFEFTPVGSDGELPGNPLSITRFIGHDVPESPREVVLTADRLTWNPVTDGAHGGYIDRDAVKYTVRLNNRVIELPDPAATETAVDIDVNAPMAYYIAEVKAVCGDYISEAAVSNKLVTGRPLELPVEIIPDEEQYMLMDVNDANGDGISWIYKDGSLECSYNPARNADDWIFLPAIYFEDPMCYYDLSLEYSRFDKYSPEAFEVGFGKTADPASMEIVMSNDNVTNFVYETAKTLLTVDEAGEYRIGIHCTSTPMGWKLLVRNIKAAASAKRLDAPQPVSGISASAVAPGINEAIVEFTMPVLTGTGESIPAGKELTAIVRSGIETRTCVAAPGERVSVRIATENGDNTIVITVSDDGAESPDATVGVSTGVDVPGMPVITGAVVSEDNMGMTLTWDAPSSGASGGYIDPSRLYYSLMEEIPYVGWIPVEEIGTERTHTLTLDAGSPLDVISYGISATDPVSGTGPAAAVSAVLGTPYDLPVEEDFTDFVADLSPIVMTGDNPSFTIYDAADADIAADIDGRPVLTVFTYLPGYSNVGFMLPKFSTEKMAAVTMNLTLFCGTYTPGLEFYGSAYGVAPVSLCKVDDRQSGWKVYSIELPAELLGKKWVTIQAGAYMNNSERILIRDYSISGISSVADVETAACFEVTSGYGYISVNAPCEAPLIISAPDGRNVVTATLGCGNNRYGVASGIYIVKAGEEVKKVMVR